MEDIKFDDNVVITPEEVAAAEHIALKFFPDTDNIWARPNIEATKAQKACIEMVKWMKSMPQLMKLVETSYDNGYLQCRKDMLKYSMPCTLGWYDGFVPDFTEEQLHDVVEQMKLMVGDKINVIILKGDCDENLDSKE